MSMEGSFKSYRVALTEANPPCIPYMYVRNERGRGEVEEREKTDPL